MDDDDGDGVDDAEIFSIVVHKLWGVFITFVLVVKSFF